MNETVTKDTDVRQDSAKKPIDSVLDWFWVPGFLCLLGGNFVPQHTLAHKALLLLAVVLMAAGRYRSYLCAVFLLCGVALVIDWMHLVPENLSPLLLLPSAAVGVVGAVRAKRKSQA